MEPDKTEQIQDPGEAEAPMSPPPAEASEPAPKDDKPLPPKPPRPQVEINADSGVLLKNLDDLGRFAGMIVTGGMAPRWASARVGAGPGWTPEVIHRVMSAAVAIAIQAGLEHGMSLLGGLQAFIVIDGKLTWRAEFAAAKIRNSKVCKKGTLRFWTEVDKAAPNDPTKMVGYAVGHRAGYKQEDVREFSWQDAVTAGLVGKKGDMYRKYPKRMLQWRALGLLGKDVFSDVLGGIPLAEEVAHYDDEAPRQSPVAIGRSRQAPSLHAALPAAQGVSSLFEELKLKKPEPELVKQDFPAGHGFKAEALHKKDGYTAPPFLSHAEADAALAAEEEANHD